MPMVMAAVPLDERPRERLAAHGVKSLGARELLALILRNGAIGRSALDLADELLADFGSLAALAVARPEELVRRPGVGYAKAAAIVAAFGLVRKVEPCPASGEVLRSAEDAARVASRELAGLRRERVVVLVCDSWNRAQCRRRVRGFRGPLACASTRDPQCVLHDDGRAFALAHNHPDGDPEPSEADRRATSKVKAAAEVAWLRFLGHVVVAGADWASPS